MEARLEGSSAFRYIDATLAPGETLISESGAVASMAAELDLKAKLNGGLFRGLARKYLGGESLFINEITNNTRELKRVVLTSQAPGDVRSQQLRAGESICLEPGSYICSTPGIKLGVRWAGFVSFFAGEGLFKLVLTGEGTYWFGGYGAFLDKELNGEYIVDSGHLVAYDPGVKLKLQLSNGIFGSFFSGEGFVTRLQGRGKVVLQTRSLGGLAAWINPRL